MMSFVFQAHQMRAGAFTASTVSPAKRSSHGPFFNGQAHSCYRRNKRIGHAGARRIAAEAGSVCVTGVSDDHLAQASRAFPAGVPMQGTCEHGLKTSYSAKCCAGRRLYFLATPRKVPVANMPLMAA
jgi:hypothetical protein